MLSPRAASLLWGTRWRSLATCAFTLEQANGVINYKLSTYAEMRKDDWDQQLPLAEFAINNADSVLGDGLTPFFIDYRTHQRLLHSPQRDDRDGLLVPCTL
jgi:hypothetical protein